LPVSLRLRRKRRTGGTTLTKRQVTTEDVDTGLSEAVSHRDQ
jgi:hypothetical protein